MITHFLFQLYIWFQPKLHNMIVFREENYTQKGILFIFGILAIVSNMYSQAPHCPIRVDLEPIESTSIRIPNEINQNDFFFFTPWDNLDAFRLSDDVYSTISLDGFRRSTVITAQNLSFSIPNNNATITELELIIEGRSSGSGLAEDVSVMLVDENGEPIGLNLANITIPIDEQWLQSDSTDHIWRYGGSVDKWGTDVTEALLENSSFGFEIQIRNALNEPIDVFIDQILVRASFLPLYRVCADHACVPFIIDEDPDNSLSYEWSIPEGWELISSSEHDPIVNIAPSFGEFGTYEICAESFDQGVSQGVCCRSFNYEECQTGSIAGQVVIDGNGNFTKDNNDELLPNVLVNLHTPDQQVISTTISNTQGEYQFLDIPLGQYFISFVNNESDLIFVPVNIGNDMINNDVDEALLAGSTGLIDVLDETPIVDIDAILSRSLSIGDFVWNDINVDGIQQSDELGIEGVEVTLSHSILGDFTQSTDESGLYLFDNLPSGEYTIAWMISETFTPTTSNIGQADTDSDFIEGGLPLSFLQGGVIDSIDAGFFQSACLGDFVWEDINLNGIQDVDEPGIEGVFLALISDDADIVATAQSDNMGRYKFSDIVPGDYIVRIEIDSIYKLTEGFVGDPDTDSDGIISDYTLFSDIISIPAGANITNIDFGFFEALGEIGGIAFLDENNDGQLTNNEQVLSNVEVQLFDENDNSIASITTNTDGSFLFTDLMPDRYYTVFELPDTLLFTQSNLDADQTDSDVTSSMQLGSTDVFNLGVCDTLLTVFGGYVVRPKVGDFVWMDENRNGLQDPNEGGINGIEVSLLDENGTVLQVVTTTENTETETDGFYLFENLDIGTYQIIFETIDTLLFTNVVGDQPSINSDVTNMNQGATSFFTLSGNECNLDVDAGYILSFGSISGVVWVDDEGDGMRSTDDAFLEDILVNLFDQNGILVSSTVSGSDGSYDFSELEMGSYYVEFVFEERYISTLPLAGSPDTDSDITDGNGPGTTEIILLNPGENIVNIDGGLIDGIGSVCGFVWEDVNVDGILNPTEMGISEITVSLRTDAGVVVSTATTDSDGNYTFENVTPGDYFIVFEDIAPNLMNTTSDPDADPNLDDDVDNIIEFGSTALFTVSFFDTLEKISGGYFRVGSIGDQVFIDDNLNGINDDDMGLDDVEVRLLSGAGVMLETTLTATDAINGSGFYVFENLIEGDYIIEFVLPDGSVFTQANQGPIATDSNVTNINNEIGRTAIISLGAGENNLTIDAGVEPAPESMSTISGVIWDDENLNATREVAEAFFEGSTVNLVDLSGTIVATEFTDANGFYLFENVLIGDYRVEVPLGPDLTTTLLNIGTDNTIDNDFTETLSVAFSIVTILTVNDVIENVDAGLVGVVSIGDFVWTDDNSNGIQDVEDIGVEGVQVIARNVINGSTFVDSTDINGAYLFDNIPQGIYRVCIEIPENAAVTLTNIGDDQFDNDANPNGCADEFAYVSSTNDVDFGIVDAGGICGVAFTDINGNNSMGDNEPGLPGIQVFLVSENGVTLDSTNTSSPEGEYSFLNILPGNYYIVFELPDNYIISDPNVGDDATDNDITGTFEPGSTDLITVTAGVKVSDVDGGGFIPGVIGDFVWEDTNRNGLQDADEVGVPNINVTIFTASSIPIETVTTDESGFYGFPTLRQGLYFLRFDIPEDFVVTERNVGLDDFIDNDADETGTTSVISLAHGAAIDQLDCGVFPSMRPSLRGTVWADTNSDGIRQDTEERVEEIRVTLFDSDNVAVASKLTNGLGMYGFQEIPDGDYKVFVDLDNTDFIFGPKDGGVDDLRDSDIDNDGWSEVFTSNGTLSVPNVDAGLISSGRVQITVWEDTNRDGIFDVDEGPIGDINVLLYNENNTLQSQLTTSLDHMEYAFDKVQDGKYYFEFEVPEGFESVYKDELITALNYNDAIYGNGKFVSNVFKVRSGDIVDYVEAGFYDRDEFETELPQQQNAFENTPQNQFETNNESEALTLDVYPNPTYNYIKINTNQPSSMVQILNAQKAVVYEMTADEIDKVDLTGLFPGLYYVRIINDKGTIVKPLYKIQ